MTRNVMRGLVTLVLVPGALLVGDSDRPLALVAAWTAGSVVMIAIGARFSDRVVSDASRFATKAGSA